MKKLLLAAALLGREIHGFDTGTLWWIAGGFALIAAFCSPVARASTEPLSGELRQWIRHRGRSGRSA